MQKPTKPDAPWLPDLEQSQEAYEVACIVAEEYGISVRDLYEHRRIHPLPEARFGAWFILFSRGMTYSHLARLFNCTHGAVLNGVKKFSGFLEYDRKVQQRWQRIGHLANLSKTNNEYLAEVRGCCTVRSNRELSETAVRERALAQVESGLVLMDVQRISKREEA